MGIDSKNIRSKSIEEFYLGLQLMSVFLLIALLKYLPNNNLSANENISTYFLIIYGCYVLVQYIYYITNVYFKDKINRIQPRLFLAFLDGIFLTIFLFISIQHFETLFHLFYIYVVLQTIRFHNRSSLIFSTYISICYLSFIIMKNPKSLISFEVLANILFFYLISYILSSILKEFNHIEAQLNYMYNEVAKKNILLESIASKDYLTNMYNHRSFYDFLNTIMKSSEKVQQPFCLSLLDIDDFKFVNDTFGHLAGDAVLKELSYIIQSKIRDQDIVARYGGEEFAILFPNTSIDLAMSICEDIRSSIEKHTFCIEDQRIKITISGGIAEAIVTETLTTQYDLVSYADELLYEAKRQGKNQIRYKEGVMHIV